MFEAAMLVIGIVLTCLGLAILFYVPEGLIFLMARMTRTPVLVITEIGSNRGWYRLARTEDVKQLLKTGKKTGYYLNSAHLHKEATPVDFGNGLQMIDYTTIDAVPLSTRNIAAFNTILKYRQQIAPSLDYLTDQDFMLLLDTPADQLYPSVERMAQTYFQKTDRVELEAMQFSLYEGVLNAQKESAALGVVPGFSCKALAFAVCPHKFVPSDLGGLVTDLRQAYLDNLYKKINLLLWAFAVSCVFMAGALAFYIITLASSSHIVSGS